MSTLRDRLREQLIAPRFNLLLVAVFATLSLAFSAAGVYALMAYTVSYRKREFGIRLAVGARASQLLCGVLTESVRVLAIGLTLGGAVAWFFTRLLRGIAADLDSGDLQAAVTAALS